jgi:hypothetical protein
MRAIANNLPTTLIGLAGLAALLAVLTAGALLPALLSASAGLALGGVALLNRPDDPRPAPGRVVPTTLPVRLGSTLRALRPPTPIRTATVRDFDRPRDFDRLREKASGLEASLPPRRAA